MPFYECKRWNPFIASAALDTEFEGVGLKVQNDQYVKKSKNREYGSFINLYHLLAVRGRVKNALESADLKGLKLIELATTLDGGAWPEGIEPLHLIWSHSVLPPTCARLIDRHSKAVYPSTQDFTYPVDGCYLEAGPLASLEYEGLKQTDFDVAITYENFGGKWGCYRRIVYSQKATDLLQKLMQDLRVKPVTNKGEPDGGGQPATRPESK